ncbi:MAG: glutathione S-transferase family protein [Pseudomonadaceae bacterium]|nr:glutathione S-transferase family protein [Pseudomonadaceae bacterium]
MNRRQETYRLYAMPHSLYSGRARSYLIKHKVPFQELSTGHESFKADVLPKAKLSTIPALVTPAGQVIRDGGAIIEYFEAGSGRPAQPAGVRQQIISALFDVIGTDGLLRPAMHYRWNFPKANLGFVRYHFLGSQRDTPARGEKTDAMMDRMRHAAMIFGVTDASRELVEALYLEYLDALNAHFEHYPYLLGWRPCIGDFGLLGPMYAHLGRDPYPARLMQQQAPRVYRWTERMNRFDQDAPEYFHAGTDLLPRDEIPESLVAVLRVLAQDFVPETEAAAEFINAWLASNRPEPGSVAVGRLAQGMGTVRFSVRGETIDALAQPHRFYLLQRVQDSYAALPAEQKLAVDELLAESGMTTVITTTLNRRIVRADNLDVWD